MLSGAQPEAKQPSAATADNVKVVLRVRPSTSGDSAWAVTSGREGSPSQLQQLDAKGVPVTTYGLGALPPLLGSFHSPQNSQ